MAYNPTSEPSGIYYILNTRNNKMYIGRTRYLYTRMNDHINMLNRGVHINREMQADWDQHSVKAFSFGILQADDFTHTLAETERQYIRHYVSDDPRFGYNRSYRTARLNVVARLHAEGRKGAHR